MKNALLSVSFQSSVFYGDLKGSPFDFASSGNLVACARLG
jgi:hypothetical protein